MVKSIHGHYGIKLEEEAKRIQKLCKEVIDVDITWREATDLAALRSMSAYWDGKKLFKELSKLRGLNIK